MKTIEEKISAGRQYRSMSVRLASSNEEEKNYKVRGYATTFNEPYTLYEDDELRIDEQVDPSAFNECDMSDVIMQYDHEGKVYARTRNNTLNLTVDDKGLLIEADLGGTEIGRQLYEEIKGGYIDRMSFGFHVDEDKRLEEKNVILRTITKIDKLYDVSAVSLPANDGTSISARSFCEGVIAEMEAERLLIQQEEERKRKLRLQLQLMEVNK